MPKENFIELPNGLRIPILFEDRSVLAIDKPRGWMLAPMSWQNTSRNLQAALMSSMAARDFWARSRNLKFIRFVHRLDADTSGILLIAKNVGAVSALTKLFEGREMEKTYLAVVHGTPKEPEWECALKLGPDPRLASRMKVDARDGKSAETFFRLLQTREGKSLIEAHPTTGRTHQIRVHLAEAGLPIVSDELYGKPEGKGAKPFGLRAVRLRYRDPFTRQNVDICAPADLFLREYGFESDVSRRTEPAKDRGAR